MKLYKHGTVEEWIKELGLVPGTFIVDNTLSIDKLDPDLTEKINAVGNGVDLVNNLNQLTPGKALDANQGRLLKMAIDGIPVVTLPTIVNNLTTTGTGSILDASQGKILDDKLTTLKGGVPSAGDSLNKLYNLIQTINGIIGSGITDGDTIVNTVTELLTVFATYQEQVDIATLINSKVTGVIVNTLTQVASGGVLDARQGKTLYDLIISLSTNINGPNQLVKLNGSGQLPAIDGSQLLNLPNGSGGSVSVNNTLTGNGTSGNVLSVNPVVITVAYSNIVSLKGIRPTVNTIARTQGYTTDNDGGSASYYFDITSNATDDGGSVLTPTVGSGAGRWLLIAIDNQVNAKQFGAVGDGTADDTNALQTAINYIVTGQYTTGYPKNRATTLYIPAGVYKTTSELVVGTLTPSFDPYRERSFVIKGAGPSGDYNYGNGTDNEGTQIRLYGTGINSILNNRRGASRFQRFENFTLSCNTLGGATYGLLFSDSRFSQPRVTNVHSVGAVNCFAVLKGTGANGEFITWEKCVGDGVQRFFYMDATSGQAFDQMFLHCSGLIDDGGQMFEIGGNNLGFGLTAISFNSSAMDNAAYVGPNFNTLAGCTFFKNNGISGYANFYSGRQEHITTILHNVSDSYNGDGQITFTGMEFDGMTCTNTRSFLKSTGINGTSNFTAKNCSFKGFYDNLSSVVFSSSFVQGDASGYNFQGCHFWGNNMGLTNSYYNKITFDNDCTLKNIYDHTVKFANKTDNGIGLSERKLNGGNIHSSYGTPSNLLTNPAFVINSNNAGTGWTHTGSSTFPVTTKAFPDVALSGWSSSPDAREIVLSGNSGIYQDITSVDLSQYNAQAYYQAVIGFHDGGRLIRFALVNSQSGKVYDEVKFMTSGNKQEFEINLIAIDSQTTGNVRLVIQNLSGSSMPVDIKFQLVSQNSLATYINGGSTAKQFAHNWSLNTDLARITGRLQIPNKSDVFGSTNTLPDLSSGEMYISSVSNTEKLYTDRWEERPRQDLGIAAPTTGTWSVGFIRYNSNPTDGSNIGWVCIATGTPGTWKPFGTIGTVTSSGVQPYVLVTTFTSAAIQSAIDSVSSNATIYLMPGTYTITSVINFAGKTNVTIEGLGAATLSGTGNLIVLNGDTTNCCFRGINFICPATGGGGQGLVSSNEQGTHKNFLVERCNFDSPAYRINGFSVNTYSALADQGNGTGKMFDGLHFNKCKFGCNGGIGRMGLEVLNHAWSDNKLDLYLKNITITECTFRDLGKVAETDGTLNGMAASISGRCIDLKVSNCTVVDGKAYGLEIVGTQGAVVTNCTFDYINNSYIPVSLADGYGNGSDATRDITISNCYMRSKTRPMNSRGTTGLALSNITWIGTTNDNSLSSALYFQKCVDVVIKGGRLSNGAYNPLRFDDCKEVVIDLPRITGTNTSFNYASISIYSGTGYTGAGSQDYRIGIKGGIFKKSSTTDATNSQGARPVGIVTISGQIYETQGTVTGVVEF